MLNPYPGPHADLISQVSLHTWTTLGSRDDNYRLKLREKLKSSLADNNLPEATNILDLNARIEHPTVSISISHSQEGSCYAWIQQPHKIGVDIELSGRITPEIVRRVSTPQEIEGCPDYKLLWPAKEAAFKALSPACEVVSEIDTFNWQQITEWEYFYSVRVAQSDKTIDGSGLVCLIPRHIISFFILKR
jgi:hypothetical protein